jgi:PadR family transcriptional regulator PadR
MYLTYSGGMRPRHHVGRGGHHRPGGRGARVRREVAPGSWEVRARIERFVEPVILLLLSERPMHGYELLERVPELAREERRVDLGNLYRLLRSLEEEGIVASEWDAGVPGPAKRVYRLTPAGRGLLEGWTQALADVRGVVDDFIQRQQGGEVNT